MIFHKTSYYFILLHITSIIQNLMTRLVSTMIKPIFQMILTDHAVIGLLVLYRFQTALMFEVLLNKEFDASVIDRRTPIFNAFVATQ